MKSNLSLSRGKTRIIDEPYAWLVLAIPATALVMGAVMLTLSMQGFDGLVSDDYYKKGKEINVSLARDRTAQSLGLQAKLVQVDGQIKVNLSSEQQGFEMPQTIELHWFHATRANADKSTTLQRAIDNSFVGHSPTANVADEERLSKWYVQLETKDWRLRSTVSDSSSASISFDATQPNGG